MKLALSLAAVTLAVAAPASAAVTISNYDIVFTSGTAVVSSGDKTAPGEYQDNFHFTTTETMTFSGALSTQRLRDLLGNIVSDLDFGNTLPGDGVYVDDVMFNLATGGGDALEVQNIGTTMLLAGDHVLTVNYTVQTASEENAAAYAGPLFLATNAVPEPASWALMIAGFGIIGGTMRRRTPVRVRFA